VNIRIILVSLLALTLSACGKDNTSPTQPTPQANPEFQATLLPINEVPAISNTTEASGSGTVKITFNVTRDASGTITGGTADFAITATGFPSTTTMTISHIHPGAAGVMGGVLVSTGQAPGQVTLTNGAGSWTETAAPITVDQINQILANPSGFYFNIHTAANPGGVARGQLTRTK
jgi:hypothetical protein